jgi:hypothetical protein
MHYTSIPEKPLSIGADGKVENAQRIYFFERSNGTRIFTQVQEAWSLYTRRPQMLGKIPISFKFLGSSTGETYRQAVIEAQQLYRETQDISKAQARLRKGEEEEFATVQPIPPPNMDKKGDGANLLHI